MKENYNSPKLILEEKKAIKLFLWLFYIFYIAFEVFSFFILPKFRAFGVTKFPRDGLGIWLYVLILAILPVTLFLMKKRNPYVCKYFILISYTLIDLIDNLLQYFGTTDQFGSGNIVEILFILFSPIFVSRKYFWSVTLGLIGKYALVGLVLKDSIVFTPIFLIAIFSAISFILVNRFYSYINSLTSVYQELRQKEKLAVIGQMAAAIGHEIRNPLFALKGFTQLQHEQFPGTNNFYPIMIDEISRIDSIVGDLMYIGKPQSMTFEKNKIEEILNYTISIIKQQAEEQDVEINICLEEPLPLVNSDEKRLKQVFLNLLKNAVESMKDGGKIEIHAKHDNEKLHVSIEDDGCGIPEESIRNLFEPFYTTKKGGTGLGLVVTNQIIKDHNGELLFHSIVDKGTTVDVYLPIKEK